MNAKPTGPDGKIADPLYTSKKVSAPICLRFNQDHKRLIALYTISIVYNDPQFGEIIDNSPVPLRIGHEVKELPTGCTPTEINPSIVKKNPAFPHYVLYTTSDNDYHIVLGTYFSP